ncbi:MAG: hypothetical protein ACRD12_14990 [Acidimicrobiales bacterium]
MTAPAAVLVREAPSPAAPAAAPAPARARRWRRPDPMAVTASALMVNTAVTSGLGMVFWALASRAYPARVLGEAAALIAAMMLLSVISQLNLSMGIARLLPQVTDRRWRPVLGAYGVTAAVALVVSGAFVIAAPRLFGGFAFLGHRPAMACALVVAVVLWNVFALQDAVLTASRWAVVVPIENGVFGLLKIGLMVWLAGHLAEQGIFVAWLGAMAVMLLPVNGFIFGRVLRSRRSPRAQPSVSALPIADRRRVTRYLALDYVAALLNQGYTSMLPLLVVAVLGRDANAYFYIAFLVAGAVRAVAEAMSTSLVVEGAHDESELASLARRSVTRYVKYAVPGVLLLAAGAGLLLAPFGAAYVDHGVAVLRLLLVATLPQAVVSLYIAVERVRANVGRVLAAEAAVVILVTAGAVAGMQAVGLVGLGWAWLVAQSVVAAAVTPGLWRACRPRAVAAV